jgi:conjugative transfer signal peptidase TraF
VYTDSRRTEISISPRRKTRPLLFVAGSVAVLFALPHWFTVNRTASSAPRGIYLRTHAPLHRGQLVEACLTHRVAMFAASRAYIHATGRCADNSEPVIKKIGGMAGDRVYVSAATILATDSGGRPMPLAFAGWHQIAEGQIWLNGSAHNSFDSRYFGALPIENVNAVLEPLWTW